VSVLFTEVGDFRAGCFEDPQPKQAEHGDQGEVEPVRGLARCGQHRLKLEVRQAECG
jgi:hypothetical protein